MFETPLACDPFFQVPEGQPKAKLVVSVMDKDVWSEDAPMGSAVLYLKDLQLTAAASGTGLEYTALTLALSDPETGDPTDMSMTVEVCVTTRDKGFDFGMETLYEYQRWSTLEQEWGNEEQDMNYGDPGKWSDQRKAYFWTLDDAAQELPDGWRGDPWRTSQSFGDNGWQYAYVFPFTGFGGALWADSAEGFNVNVRRRLWYRAIRGHAT